MALVAGVVVLVVLLGTLWAVGGLRAAPRAPQVQPGRWVEGERLRLKPRTAQVTTQKPGALASGQEDTRRYLVVTVDAENTAEKSKLTSWLMRDAVTARTRPDVTLSEKTFQTTGPRRSIGNMLQPDLPKRVNLLWTLPPDAPVPREVTLVINDFVYREDFFSRRMAWKPVPNDVLARVTMPVRGGPP